MVYAILDKTVKLLLTDTISKYHTSTHVPCRPKGLVNRQIMKMSLSDWGGGGGGSMTLLQGDG